MFLSKNNDLFAFTGNSISSHCLWFLRPNGVLIISFAEHPWLQNAKKAPNVPLGDVVKSRLKQFSVMNRFKRRALRVG